ncbi:MAG: hypothetical protein GXO64_02030 [Candidatus Micrarchaeota archaeon]|nr:hypothetical protein [Candidatus Micrarchaeota archaeon]
MKHTWVVTLMILSMFFATQVFGLFALTQAMNVEKAPDGTISLGYSETAIGERPQMDGFESFIYIIGSIIVGTGLLLLLIRLKKLHVWKIFFFMAVWMSVTILIGVFIDPMISFVVGFILALSKLYSRNVMLFNLTEMMMYGGITVLFAPLMDMWWMALLLVVISFYDMFAVWKSKHMVTMAKSMTKNNIFAGFAIPYRRSSKSQVATKKRSGTKAKSNMAILGGGDVAFPLLFAGSVLNYIVKMGIPKFTAFCYALIIPVFVTLALFLLFWKAKKDKFYPAMPFVSAGAFAGLLIMLALI